MNDDHEPVEEFPFPIELTRSIEESLATSNIDKLADHVLTLTYAITTPGDLSTPSAVKTQNWAVQKLVEMLTDRRLRDLPESFPAFTSVQLDWAEFPEQVRATVFDAVKDVLRLFKDSLAICVFVEMLAKKSPPTEGLDCLEYLFTHEWLRFLVVQNLAKVCMRCPEVGVR